MLDKAKYIVVEGPIGAGKTSLARRLSERLNADLTLEQPELNPFLARFYSDMPRWALATQLAFLYQRVDQLQQQLSAEAGERRVVSDFILDKDPLFAELNLEAEEFKLYQRSYDLVVPQPTPKPDLVIYLQAKPTTLIERIARRGMAAERPITAHYLERVAERYARFFYQYDASPLFIVDAEVLNPVDHSDDFDLLVERLRAMRSFREFFGYA
ncbi:MAG: deoxynucleoside kinase [Rhodocyclaceae bacterium]|nr:deoxynucleoside kinase [Rhodocyclaceae bacterium]